VHADGEEDEHAKQQKTPNIIQNKLEGRLTWKTQTIQKNFQGAPSE
jgi:hypothetical protein